MQKKPRRSSDTGRFSYDGLDRVLHEKARLGIMTSLTTRPEGLVFSELKQLCSLTDGNLARHLEVLADAGLVQSWKGTDGSRPQTLLRVTAEGRERFLEYLGELERVLRDAQSAAQSRRAIGGVPPGFVSA